MTDRPDIDDDIIGTEVTSDSLFAYILFAMAISFACGLLIGWYAA